VKQCSNALCKNQVEDDAVFCGMCGTYVGPDITLKGKLCPNCGRALQSGENFCPHCGSMTPWIDPEANNLTIPSTPRKSATDPQANIPTMPASRVSPPLAATRITSDELRIVRNTSKNVYAPFMRNLIHVPETSYSRGDSDFSPNARYISDRLALLKPEMEVTDFTLQAVLDYPPVQEAQEWDVDALSISLSIGFVFRLNDQTGEGCYLLLNEGDEKEQWGLYLCDTRSELTGEPLPRPHLGQKLGSGSISRFFGEGFVQALVAIVAQGTTIDIYADLKHIARVENVPLLHGKLGVHFWPYQAEGHCMGAKDLKVWIP